MNTKLPPIPELSPDQQEKVSILSQRIFSLGVDPVLLLHHAIKETRSSTTMQEVRSCINCNKQNTCTIRDMALHLAQVEMPMDSQHSIEQYSHEIFSITAENCTNYGVIDGWSDRK
jgi:hypothetical protein